MDSLATTRFDGAFRGIPELTWLPWVGNCFAGRVPERRMLVVGESHYFKTEAERDERLKNPTYTKEIVWEQLVNVWWENGNKTLDTIPKLLFRTNRIDRHRLWGNSAYYNFIQRLMDYSWQERPTPSDYETGWKVFMDVVTITRPSHCLFIGVAASNYFDDSMKKLNASFENVKWTQQIGRTWARVAKVNVAGSITELIFVQHLGKYFSWENWHDYLLGHHSNLMSWLAAESYQVTGNST